MSDAPRTVVYVMGQDRSGSTILADAVGQAPGFAHVGEVRNVWRAGLVRGGLCGCGRPVRECEVWGPATREALDGGDPGTVLAWLRAAVRPRHLRSFLRAAPGRSLGVPEADAYVTLAARLYPRLFEAIGARVVVDSSKHPVYGALLAAVPGLDVRFVHLVRDPRAVAYSWGREAASPGRPGNRMWRAPGRHAARAWVLSNLAADRVRARYPDRSMLLRYEDAMGAPRAAVEAMLRHAGHGDVEPPVEPDGSVILEPRHAAAGNPVRLSTGRVQLRRDDAWRTAQRPRDRLVVMALTAPFLRRYGYAGRPAPADHP